MIPLFLWIEFIVCCLFVCLFCCADATPTESEREVYNVVSSVLDEAPRILKELQDYQGANEEIRQVKNYILSIARIEGMSYRKKKSFED